MSTQENDTALAQRAPNILTEAPVLDSVDERKLALIQRTVAKDCTREEVGMFLELAHKYDLDPFAHEVWCAKSKGQNARLLIMVGRDGLRKVAQRNGLRIDGDVVREHDEFRVHRTADRRRAIEHGYAAAREADDAARTNATTHAERARGPIVGAWAEVWDDETGEQRGWFYAPIEEYKPTNPSKLQYSPWGSQESVMILAAAERQALRQATPLGGLLVEGEVDRNEERAGRASARPSDVVVEEIADAEIVESPLLDDEQREKLSQAIEASGVNLDLLLSACGLESLDGISEAKAMEVSKQIGALMQKGDNDA